MSGRRTVDMGSKSSPRVMMQYPDRLWAENAACRSMGPNLFYPDYAAHESVTAAKKVCEVCPVRADCLEWALVTRQGDGIWGGTSGQERDRILRRRARTRRGALAG